MTTNARIGTIGVFLLAVVLSGCVTKGRYNRDLEETRRQGADEVSLRDVRIGELNAELSGKRQELARLQSEREKDRRKIASLEEEISLLQGRLAALLKEQARFTASIDEMQMALDDMVKRRIEAEARVAQFRELLDRFRALIDAGTLRVKMVDGRMVLELPSDVLFPSGSARLSPKGTAAIDEVAEVLLTLPERELQVEGHTDDVPISTERFPSNWELAAARALTVVHRMIAAGMPGDRVSAASYGEFRPAASNETAEERRLNRRIEIVVVPDLSQLPGYAELEEAFADR